MDNTAKIKEILQAASIDRLPEFIAEYEEDPRSSVQKLVASARKKLDALEKEYKRIENLKKYEKEYGEYHYCPMFDHGGALLSDTTLDYPVTGDVYTLIESAKPKTFCDSFEEQLDIAEELYGQPIQFSFNSNDIDRLLREEQYYSEDRKARIGTILRWQKHRYQYLFR